MERLTAIARAPGRTTVSGAPQGYDAYIAAEAALRLRELVLFVAADDARAAVAVECARFFAPEKPPGDVMKHISRRGIDAQHARALIAGFALFPEELPAHCEQLAGLLIADKGTAHLRDELVNAAFSGAALDRTALATILGTEEAGGKTAPRSMGFSFTRRDSDPDRARSDLAAAVEIIAAAEEVEKALEDATQRLKRDQMNHR